MYLLTFSWIAIVYKLIIADRFRKSKPKTLTDNIAKSSTVCGSPKNKAKAKRAKKGRAI